MQAVVGVSYVKNSAIGYSNPTQITELTFLCPFWGLKLNDKTKIFPTNWEKWESMKIEVIIITHIIREVVLAIDNITLL